MPNPNEERTRLASELLWDGTLAAVMVVDPATHIIVDVNRRALQMMGRSREQVVGSVCHRFVCPAEEGKCPITDLGKTVDHTDRVLLGADDRRVPILKSVNEVVVEGRSLLLHAQKMESVGTLASGIAHDFNNILLATIGFSDAAAEKLPPGHPAVKEIEAVIAASERGADLIRQPLAFGRQQDLQMRCVDLNELVQETRRLLTHVLPKNVATELWLGDRIPPVLADPVQIEQVLMNLAANARDAMPGGGTLTIATEPLGMMDMTMTAPLGLTPGLYVLLRVRDTGEGMTPQVVERIFEPFFTTKEEGRGTGLGLSTVYGIVAQHGGTIRVDTAPGCGTVFTVWLPAFEGRGGDAPLPRGGETVLIVEDEAPTRRVLARILENLGYTVLETAGEEECVGVVEARGAQVGLVLCDILLTGTCGPDLIGRLRERKGNLKVLYMSGHSREYLAKRGLLADTEPLVGKATGPGGIARAVRAALDR